MRSGIAGRRGQWIAALCVLAAPSVFAATAKTLSVPADAIVVRPAERTVTIDVKDAEARDILRSMQKQCGVKNLVFDPEVTSAMKGTFLFKGVPCRTAFSIVLKSLGLSSVTYSKSLVSVGEKPRG